MLLAWQWLDSAFPTGGFAHSNGLEAAWQYGEVRGSSELAAFTRATLDQATYASVPWLVAAWDDPSQLPFLDEACDVLLLNHVANRASRLQGQALWNSTRRVFQPTPTHAWPTKPEFLHQAPVFGALSRIIGLDRSIVVHGFLFQQVRSVLSSAVRLGVTGPLDAQRLQSQLAPTIASAASQGTMLKISDAAQTSPLLEVWQGAHDRLYSRLFQS